MQVFMSQLANKCSVSGKLYIQKIRSLHAAPRQQMLSPPPVEQLSAELGLLLHDGLDSFLLKLSEPLLVLVRHLLNVQLGHLVVLFHELVPRLVEGGKLHVMCDLYILSFRDLLGTVRLVLSLFLLFLSTDILDTCEAEVHVGVYAYMINTRLIPYRIVPCCCAYYCTCFCKAESCLAALSASRYLPSSSHLMRYSFKMFRNSRTLVSVGSSPALTVSLSSRPSERIWRNSSNETLPLLSGSTWCRRSLAGERCVGNGTFGTEERGKRVGGK